jgi:two-component system, cell cycle response regulator
MEIHHNLDVSSPNCSEQSSMRILIAEDDLTARTILVGILKKWGYDPLAVKDGKAACEVLSQPGAPHLVILDWMMPEMDGLDVIRFIRSHFIEQVPYIILLTSKDEKGDILVGLEAGANDYVRKPFDHEELYARIRVGQRTLELQTRLYETHQTLAHLAAHDALTGILNRRAILEQLSKELARSVRTGSRNIDDRLSIGYFDIDHFKQINDQYGHLTGDEVLRATVNVLVKQMRPYDWIGRLGGDEFLILAPGTDEGNSRLVFERLVKAVAGHTVVSGSAAISVTLSMGVTISHLESSVDQLLDCVDKVMYQAKREGGNRVVFAFS